MSVSAIIHYLFRIPNKYLEHYALEWQISILKGEIA